jgi:hypothetical protein
MLTKNIDAVQTTHAQTRVLAPDFLLPSPRYHEVQTVSGAFVQSIQPHARIEPEPKAGDRRVLEPGLGRVRRVGFEGQARGQVGRYNLNMFRLIF